jgi:hypothetical protein
MQVNALIRHGRARLMPAVTVLAERISEAARVPWCALEKMHVN